jgi:Xaa-Pro aminopeptidase
MANLDLLERLIAQSPFDAVIAVSPENVRYAADVHIATQRSIRDRLAWVLWPRGEAPTLIVCEIEAPYARAHTWISDVQGYREFDPGPVRALADLLAERGLSNGRVAIETDYLPAAAYRELLAHCPGLRVDAAEPVFAAARMHKTPAERAQIIAAFHATEKAFLHAFTSARIGETEKQVAVRLAERMLTEGADQVTSNYCNAGRHTGFPHMVPSGYRLAQGDLLKADSGGMFRQYFSNVGRTAKLGPPSAKDLSVWSALRDVHHAVIDACRPGRALVSLHAQRALAGTEHPRAPDHSCGRGHPVPAGHDHDGGNPRPLAGRTGLPHGGYRRDHRWGADLARHRLPQRRTAGHGVRVGQAPCVAYRARGRRPA